MPRLTAVAALSDNNVIAKDGGLPWPSIKEDKEQYRALVDGHPLIFGENTYSPRQQRRDGQPILVLSYDADYETYSETHTVATSKQEALDWIAEQDDADVFVMGGGQMYHLFWEDFDRLVLSHIPGTYEGDLFFPEIHEGDWDIEEVKEYEEFTRVTYVRP